MRQRLAKGDTAMGFFRKMFGTDPATQPEDTLERYQPAMRPGIRYDPKLIDALLSEHARLGSLFGRIGTLNKAGDYAEVRALLAHFKSSCRRTY